MNYKVMQRPMFKLGGKAASQGTGITSGLDEKTNYSIGGGVIQGQNMGAREGFQDPVSSFDMTGEIQDLMNQRSQNINKQMSGLDSMRDIVKLNALGQLVGNVLPNVERGGFKGITDFFRDPMTTQAAIQGLTGLKKVDLKQNELRGSKLDSLIKDKINIKTMMQGDEKFTYTKEQAIKNGERADRKLAIAEKQLLNKTATQIRYESGIAARKILTDNGVSSFEELPSNLQREYLSLSALSGDTLSVSDATKLAVTAVLRQQQEMNAERAEQGLGPKNFTEQEFQTKQDFLTKQYLTGFTFNREKDAQGGRVGRQMGSPMMGEQPMAQAPQMMAPQQDVAMETQQGGGQDSGNQVYAMLRSRLPQEVSDEVVQLISYNKEAFADFASIKNQEDVSSFNDKYGVQLVIDVATV